MNRQVPVWIERRLTDGWQMASAAPGLESREALGELKFIPAQVPGTVASALRVAGLWHEGAGVHFDDRDHWFRCRFEAEAATPGEAIALKFEGIATLAEAWLNGHPIGTSASMFHEWEADVTRLLQATNELVIVCRALNTKAYRRKAPLARWRTRVTADQHLRWVRTTLLGRAPGFAPEPEPVGPWRPVTLVRRRVGIQNWECKTWLQGGRGHVKVAFEVDCARPIAGRLYVGDESAALVWEGAHAQGVCDLAVRLWWPHTHGGAALYAVRVVIQLDDGSEFTWDDVPAGFRAVEARGESPGDEGLALRINGVDVFCRGVVWTPMDAVSLQRTPDELRSRLILLREAGINLIRIVGTAWYEDELFQRLCDELGMLVWQDMMFANMDYPFGDETFHAQVHAEGDTQCKRLARHVSTAVICGNSEIEQQAAMLGLAPETARAHFFGMELAGICARHLPGIPYLPSAPCGGGLPFRTNRGVANYFGVGAYLRPMEDARLSGVRFASECLAFSNVPEPEAIDEMAASLPGGISPTHPVWKRGVPRDAGVGWDFEDVRDHYLKMLYRVDPVAVRYASIERYFELSRLVTGEVMAQVLGEWRRAGSPCSGGIVLWCNDLAPGAGWGIIDSAGRAKAAYWFLKRALAPVAVWMTDEGLNGMDVHVASDGPEALEATLRVALYQHGERLVGQASLAIDLGPHSSATQNVEAILGHFVDASYAYRFAPPGHDVVVASLSVGEQLRSQSFHFPAGRDLTSVPVGRLGIAGTCRVLENGHVRLTLTAARLAWGVRIAARGCQPGDQYFGLEPGVSREIVLVPNGAVPSAISITAVNAEGRVVIPVESRP